MKQFKADLHIHTTLSPCGSLDMSPKNIIAAALKAGLDMIAITDHNSTKQVQVIKELGQSKGIEVIGGAEINSSEEVHCLTLFETGEVLQEFQEYLDRHLVPVKNDPAYFGYQVVVNANDEIIEEEDRLLISTLDVGVVEIEQAVHKMGGLFIPAHIDRPFNGIISQLGFVPYELKADAYGLTRHADLVKWQNDKRVPENAVFLRNSDAHRPRAIGRAFSIFEMNDATFSEMRKTLIGENGRKIILPG
ncbi:MAG: PHP domain-containing protein [Prolixibacteraceae bacterium]|nr:PHP domain-containing protein [Prolixibacteraceae bacterium]